MARHTLLTCICSRLRRTHATQTRVASRLLWHQKLRNNHGLDVGCQYAGRTGQPGLCWMDLRCHGKLSLGLADHQLDDITRSNLDAARHPAKAEKGLLVNVPLSLK